MEAILNSEWDCRLNQWKSCLRDFRFLSPKRAKDHQVTFVNTHIKHYWCWVLKTDTKQHKRTEKSVYERF